MALMFLGVLIVFNSVSTVVEFLHLVKLFNIVVHIFHKLVAVWPEEYSASCHGDVQRPFVCVHVSRASTTAVYDNDEYHANRKLSCRRETARCSVLVIIESNAKIVIVYSHTCQYNISTVVI